jgi:hypothetical protein
MTENMFAFMYGVGVALILLGGCGKKTLSPDQFCASGPPWGYIEAGGKRHYFESCTIIHTSAMGYKREVVVRRDVWLENRNQPR